MPAPTINVSLSTTPSPRARPGADGTAVIIGVSRTGPVGLLTRGRKLHSHTAWLAGYGGGSIDEGRLAHSVDSDVVEEFFQDGGAGAGMYYGRAVGPAAAKATLNIPGTSGTGLVATFDEYGDLPQERRLKVINGPVGGSGYRVVQLTEADGTTVIAQTVEYNANTTVNGVKLDAGGLTPMTLTLGGGSGLTPVMAATAPTGGTDDYANITQTQIDAALSYINADLGNANIAAPNWGGSSVVGAALLNHAAIFNRFACIDTADTQTKGTVLTQANALQGITHSEHGSLITPWIEIPPLAFNGTPRAVPGSALQLAKWAETDATDGPNQAAAGRWGVSQYATGVRATYNRMPKGTSDADDLADAGVNLIVLENDEIKVFDNLTLADPASELGEVLGQNQTVRYVKAKIQQFTNDAADERFAKINRDNLARWGVKISGHLLRDLQNGDLFVDDDDPRPETAFNVDAGGSTNTGPNSAATMNAGEMNVNVGVRPVKGARMININLSVAAMTQPVA